MHHGEGCRDILNRAHLDCVGVGHPSEAGLLRISALLILSYFYTSVLLRYLELQRVLRLSYPSQLALNLIFKILQNLRVALLVGHESTRRNLLECALLLNPLQKVSLLVDQANLEIVARVNSLQTFNRDVLLKLRLRIFLLPLVVHQKHLAQLGELNVI